MVLLSPFVPMVIHWRQWWRSNSTTGVIDDNGDNDDPLGIQWQ
jgi:hypothetical protein